MRSKQLGLKFKFALMEKEPDEQGKWTQSRLARELSINKNVLNKFINGEGGLPDDAITTGAKILDCTFKVDADGIDYIINEGASKSY